MEDETTQEREVYLLNGPETIDADFELTTSLRWRTSDEPPYTNVGSYHLPQLDGIPLHYHRDRLLAAAEAFQWSSVALLLPCRGLDLLLSKLTSFTSTLPSRPGTYKLRLTISPAGAISITASPPIPAPLFPLCPTLNPFDAPPTPSSSPLPTVYIAPTLITPSPHTHHKTTSRSAYAAILAHLPPSITTSPPTTAEILLYNPSNQIMECVYSTPYFQRDHRYTVTPEASCGGNLGVTRRLALEKGWCTSGIIMKESVKDGEVVWLSNAVRGFWAARVALDLPGHEHDHELDHVKENGPRAESRARTRSRTRMLK